MNNDCPTNMQCFNGFCIDPCLRNGTCGELAQCSVQNHKARCSCIEGTDGDAYDKCIAPLCRANKECPLGFACLKGQCKDPCMTLICGENAKCSVQEHIGYCQCPPGYFGRPNIKCEISDISQRPVCKLDSDCEPGLVCDGEKCINPCLANPCGLNAICKVRESSPYKTIMCACKNEYTGDAYSRCKPSKH